MKRFWQFSVAMVLGLATLSPAMGQQNGGQRRPQVGPQQQAGPQMGAQQNAYNTQLRQPIPQRVPLAQQQAQAQLQQSNPPNGGALHAQGVNRNPGQQGVVTQQPQNQQFLGTNLQGPQNTVPPQNQLDEFGANVNQANRVIAAENQRRQSLSNGGNSLDNGTPNYGSEQLYGSSGGFVPANLGGTWGTSSIEEGILSGQGRYMQGAGEYNRNSAEAVKTLEQARALYLENARTRLKTYFELKDLNAKYRAARAPMPISKEKLDEWNRDDQPERLSRVEYNSDTGRIKWPSVLMTSAFDADRMEVDALFARRTANEHGVTSEFFNNVRRDTAKMQATLKAYLRSEERFFTDEEYITAKNFLDSLTHEARLAPDLDGLAAY